MLLKSLKFKPQIQLAGGDWIWGAPSLIFIFYFFKSAGQVRGKVG